MLTIKRKRLVKQVQPNKWSKFTAGEIRILKWFVKYYKLPEKFRFRRTMTLSEIDACSPSSELHSLVNMSFKFEDYITEIYGFEFRLDDPYKGKSEAEDFCCGCTLERVFQILKKHKVLTKVGK